VGSGKNLAPQPFLSPAICSPLFQDLPANGSSRPNGGEGTCDPTWPEALSASYLGHLLSRSPRFY
jgi:hypothetical protein